MNRLVLVWICPGCFGALDEEWFCVRCRARTDSPMLEVRSAVIETDFSTEEPPVSH
jgi:hypothetical protein